MYIDMYITYTHTYVHYIYDTYIYIYLYIYMYIYTYPALSRSWMTVRVISSSSTGGIAPAPRSAPSPGGLHLSTNLFK